MRPLTPFRFGRTLALGTGLCLGLTSALAQSTVTTVPVGAMTVTISAGTGTVYSTSQISAPLLAEPLVLSAGSIPVTPSGVMYGVIASVTANTIKVTSAGWTPSQLSLVGYPMFAIITSGTNQGRSFYITGNTADTLTVGTQGSDLSALSFTTGANGDTYRIVPGDTLLGLFGTPADGVVGGTAQKFSAGQVDKVLLNDINSNTLLTYYYNTDNNKWMRSGSTSDQGNMVISPLAGVSYQRIGSSEIKLTCLGTVPPPKLKTVVATLGTTIVARFFPTDTTLAQIRLQDMPGWRQVGLNGITFTKADKAIIKNGSALLAYYFDSASSTWKRSGSSADQGVVQIMAGSSIMIQRAGQVGGYSVCDQSDSYSL